MALYHNLWYCKLSEISASPNVTIGPHRFGGIEFRLGKREMGHLQGPGDKAPFEILVLSASIKLNK